MDMQQIDLYWERILDLEKVPNKSRKFFINGKCRFVFNKLEQHKNDKAYLEYVLQGISE